MTVYASEWFAATDAVANEMRKGAYRSHLTPQRLHRHPHGGLCNDRCEDIPAPTEDASE